MRIEIGTTQNHQVAPSLGSPTGETANAANPTAAALLSRQRGIPFRLHRHGSQETAVPAQPTNPNNFELDNKSNRIFARNHRTHRRLPTPNPQSRPHAYQRDTTLINQSGMVTHGSTSSWVQKRISQRNLNLRHQGSTNPELQRIHLGLPFNAEDMLCRNKTARLHMSYSFRDVRGFQANISALSKSI